MPQYSHNNILETKENTDYIKKIMDIVKNNYNKSFKIDSL